MIDARRLDSLHQHHGDAKAALGFVAPVGISIAPSGTGPVRDVREVRDGLTCYISLAFIFAYLKAEYRICNIIVIAASDSIYIVAGGIGDIHPLIFCCDV